MTQKELKSRIDKAVKFGIVVAVAIAKAELVSLLIKKHQSLAVRLKMSAEVMNMAAELHAEELKNATD